MSEKDKANLLAILDSCDKIEVFIDEVWDADSFYADTRTFDAVLMNFVVIGEAVARLSSDIKSAHATITWQQIKQFRNIVAHNYFGDDAEEVWQIVERDLPDLKSKISSMVVGL